MPTNRLRFIEIHLKTFYSTTHKHINKHNNNLLQ